MKKKFTVLIAVTLFGIVAITPIAVRAATTEDTTETTKETTTQDKIEKTLDSRYQQYKKDHPNALTKAQLTRLKNLCKPAQIKTKKYTEAAVKKGDKRLKLYQDIVTKLEDVTKKLKEYSGETKPNTIELEVKVTELKAKVESFKVDLSTYQVALNDLSSVNCEEFTDTFKAALDEVRDKQKALVTSSTEIKTLITEGIKPELVKIKEALSAQTDATDNQDEKDQTNG